MKLYESLIKELEASGIDVVIRATEEEVNVAIQDRLSRSVIFNIYGESVEEALSKALATIVTRASHVDMLSVL